MAEATYTPHPLAGAFERVKRAGEHLDDLRPRIEAMRQQQEQAFLAHFDLNPLHEGGLPDPMPASMRVPILVGEICYNLRGALDYLIFELAKRDAGVPQKNTQFPIVDTPEKFRSEGLPRLKGVNDTHVLMIERLQPYHDGCDWAGSLREISNPDKRIKEETAIRGRAYEVGYDFTLFIPLDQAPTVPRWLPKTQIWFNFERWGSAGAAAIIEQKAQERGGQAREESVLDRAARLGRAIEYENRRRRFLGSSEGVQAAQVELTALCDEIESLSINEAVRALKIVHKRDMLHTVLLTENNSLGLDVSCALRYSNTIDGAKLKVTFSGFSS